MSSTKYHTKTESDAICELKNILADELRQTQDLLIGNTGDNFLTQFIPTISKHIFSRGGKRIRSLLILSSGLMIDSIDKKHIQLAAILECLHNTTLLHDDVIDNSDKRRGEDNVNKIWGSKVSILMGDFLLSKALSLASETDDMRVIKILADASAKLAEGELWQIELLRTIDISESDYISLIAKKTASLFAASTELGAIASNATKDDIMALREYGNNFGLAFQIVDDVLDYTSDEESLGKPVCTDLKEGKVTLPFIIAYKEATVEDKVVLYDIFNKHDEITKQDIEKIILIFQKYQVIEKVISIANKYVDAAINCLQHFGDSNIKSLLTKLVIQSVMRCT